jgi:hypothetical protein
MARVFIHQDLVLRIIKYGLKTELRGFVTAIIKGQHPPRIYKPSGINPVFIPYQDLGLHHHHLHRDGDPLLVTQHVDDEIYGVALTTHETYFRQDNMQWLKENADAIDWSLCEYLKAQVMSYDPLALKKPTQDADISSAQENDDDGVSDDIPF